MTKPVVNMRYDQDVLEKVDRDAHRLERSRAWVVNRILADFYLRNPEGLDPAPVPAQDRPPGRPGKRGR